MCHGFADPRAAERRDVRDGRQGGIAVWCWENAPEVWKTELEHHTCLIVCFLAKTSIWLKAANRKLGEMFQKLEGFIDGKKKSSEYIAEGSFI